MKIMFSTVLLSNCNLSIVHRAGHFLCSPDREEFVFIRPSPGVHSIYNLHKTLSYGENYIQTMAPSQFGTNPVKNKIAGTTEHLLLSMGL